VRWGSIRGLVRTFLRAWVEGVAEGRAFVDRGDSPLVVLLDGVRCICKVLIHRLVAEI